MKKLLSILPLVMLISCNKDEVSVPPGIDVRQEMRDFVIGISQYAKSSSPGFAIIPQNGIELVSGNGQEDGNPVSDYLAAIDGNGQEDLFYGYSKDDKATSSKDISYLRAFLDKSKNAGKTILVTDYCSTHSNMDDSYKKNESAGYVSFAASERELNVIPGYPAPVHSVNNNLVTGLPEVKNFLYLINPEKFTTKEDFINAVASTNYDLLIMDLFFNENTEFTSDEIERMKNKANGGKRLVVCYMSIGEAEDYRYYWQSDWSKNKPSWLERENPDWPGNYKVRYWEQEWKDIIYGNDGSYLKKILNAGFDGVYLDIIDAFEYFE